MRMNDEILLLNIIDTQLIRNHIVKDGESPKENSPSSYTLKICSDLISICFFRQPIARVHYTYSVILHFGVIVKRQNKFRITVFDGGQRTQFAF